MNRGSPSKRLRRGAFTLIELLVVVAIIALLISILIPSLARARRQARRLQCAANLHAQAAAQLLYLAEANEFFDKGNDVVSNYGGVQGWPLPLGFGPDDSQFGNDPNRHVPKFLNPYLGLPTVTPAPVAGSPRLEPPAAAHVFSCPSDRGGGIAATKAWYFFGNSYRSNTLLIGQNALNPLLGGPYRPVYIELNKYIEQTRLSQVSTAHSRLVLFGDYGWLGQHLWNSEQKIDWHERDFTHNLAFLDGHAEFVRVRKGLLLADDYAVLPFSGQMGELVHALQREFADP